MVLPSEYVPDIDFYLCWKKIKTHHQERVKNGVCHHLKVTAPSLPKHHILHTGSFKPCALVQIPAKTPSSSDYLCLSTVGSVGGSHRLCASLEIRCSTD